MTATYTPNLRITKQGDNDNPNTWGQVVNNQIVALFEEALAGVTTIDITGVSDVDLSASVNNGASDVARNMTLLLTGTLGASIDLIVPSVEKLYMIKTDFTGNYTVTIKPVGSPTGIVLENQVSKVLVTNGTEIHEIAGSVDASLFLQRTANLSDLEDIEVAKANLNMGDLAAQDTVTPAFVATGYGLVPSGTVLDYAGATAPTGFLLCDGSLVSRTVYATLFSVIGTTYGAGDGSTTFTLPDTRGRVVAGKDNMGGTAAGRLTLDRTQGVQGSTLGATGGEQSHTPITEEMAAHNHVTCNNGQIYGSFPDAVKVKTGVYTGASISIRGWPGYGLNESYYLSGLVGDPVMGITTTDGGGEKFNVVQPTIILNKIIKV